MVDRRRQGIDFWYDFDNQTLWRRTPEIQDAIIRAVGPFGGSLDTLPTLFALSHKQPNHPTPFLTAIQSGSEGLVDLAEAQRRIFVKHFGNDAAALRSAFEDYGQGILFDSRPPRRRTHFIHMMDGTPRDWVGYHRWHAFMRAAIFFGADAAWYEQLCRNIAIAWGVQTEANPKIDEQNNPGLPAERLAIISQFWERLPLKQIDDAFVEFNPAAPTPEMLEPRAMASFEMRAQQTRFQRVQGILDQSAGDGRPFHEGSDRFWRLPLDQFVALTIYDVQLIAPKGPQRGARSGLIKALKGELPFGPGGDFPRMPLDRPPVAPVDIAYIEKWIDDDCPDEGDSA